MNIDFFKQRAKRCFLCSLFLLSPAPLLATPTSFTLFQKDADILRLRHLQYYNNLIEEYRRIEGHYPLQNNDPKAPVYVFIANKNQQKFVRPGPPFAHIDVPFKKFVAEIERVTGKEMDELYDPQQTPEKKPNFYIYMVWGDKYALTVHLHNEYPFTKKRAAGYNRLVVSNQSNNLTHAILPRRLFANSAYKEAAATEIRNKKLFESLKEKYLHDSKKQGK